MRLTPQIAYNLAEQAHRVGLPVAPELEHVIAQDTGMATLYAFNIHGPWPEVEHMILQDPEWADLYKHDVLGVPKVVSIGWEDFAEALHLGYDGPDEFLVMDNAGNEAHSWLQENTRGSVPDVVREEVRLAIEQGISDHWSLRSVLTRALNVQRLVDAINDWSKRGQQMSIYERKIPVGAGISQWGSGEDGLSFSVHSPFLAAYIEAVYCVSGFGDEGLKLGDVEGRDVAATMRRIAECEGWSFKLDLDRWDEHRRHPSHRELMTVYNDAMSAHRRSKRSRSRK